ncbi:MAG: transglutaminase-like domain-containing protein [Bacillota bacterium]|nr:transglutaminase-like domain-containing protein [Bacillota bacterium]
MKGRALAYTLVAAVLLLASAGDLLARDGVSRLLDPPLVWGGVGTLALLTLLAAWKERTFLALLLPGMLLAAAWGLEVSVASWGLPLLFLVWLFFLMGRPGMAAFLQVSLVASILLISPQNVPATADTLQAWASTRFPLVAALTDHKAFSSGFIFSGPWLELEGPFRAGRQHLFQVAVKGDAPLPVLYLYTGVRSYYDGRRWQEEAIPPYLNVPADVPALDYRFQALQPLPTMPIPGPFREGGEKVAVSPVFTHPYPSLAERSLALPALPPKLADLAATLHPGTDSLDQKSQRIMAYLHTLRYDVNPPIPPPGEDFVSYFLFESQRGYCTSFASAMVILLRLQGVPALLAEGYRVPLGPPDEEGWQQGLATASMAHTWVLAYDEQHGVWRRYDPTPGLGDALPTAGDPASPSGILEEDFLPLPPPRDVSTEEVIPEPAGPAAIDPALPAASTPSAPPVDPQTLSLLLALVLFPLFAVATALRTILRPALWTWQQAGEYTLQGLALLGFHRLPGETLARFLRRAGQSYPEIAAALLTLEKSWQAFLYGRPAADLPAPSPAFLRTLRGFFRHHLGLLREEALYLDRPRDEAAAS